MNRNVYAAHEGLKQGIRSPEAIAARERFLQAQARGQRIGRAKVRVLKALLLANAIIWPLQFAGGAL